MSRTWEAGDGAGEHAGVYRGYERVPVIFGGESTVRWVADNLGTKVSGAAAAASAAPTFSSMLVSSGTSDPFSGVL